MGRAAILAITPSHANDIAPPNVKPSLRVVTIGVDKRGLTGT